LGVRGELCCEIDAGIVQGPDERENRCKTYARELLLSAYFALEPQGRDPRVEPEVQGQQQGLSQGEIS
jgi:hypothetical protein